MFERVRAELEQAPRGVHAEALRQVASNAALEQRRCLQFRDKWINRPLPYEDVRPLLTDIVNAAANGLTEYRDVNPIADDLDALARLIQPAPRRKRADRSVVGSCSRSGSGGEAARSGFRNRRL